MTESTKQRGQALSTERRGEVMIIWIDVPGAPVNTLDPQMVGEFEAIFGEIEKDSALKGVVLASAKTTGFIAGAEDRKSTRLNSSHT